MIRRRLRRSRPPKWWRYTRYYLRAFDDWSYDVWYSMPLGFWILVGALLINIENWILAHWFPRR